MHYIYIYVTHTHIYIYIYNIHFIDNLCGKSDYLEML